MTKTKLPRPVTIGDVLVHPGGHRNTAQFVNAATNRAYAAQGWTHEDGAPVDANLTQQPRSPAA